ncbi:hypothetical protein SAMN05421741_12926 [Paenimyroides ummariense]|uniref:Uncharacterized protein n=1 Tax=Paenimyroides ummariense TaxID=913024 RepID=A0A1I5FL12_9FLAO|nr:hypothetical protein [Paenimyroides ummariense]SFO24460.1 hypothetical protein SAMN05421741_12926 [Paenimyroides ummariense]
MSLKKHPCFPMLLVLTLLMSFNCFAQDGIFNIRTNYTTKEQVAEVKELLYSQTKETAFYEDEHYTVYRKCRGEWGGVIIFENKQSGNKYICAATCPVTVNKFNDVYYVTNTLHHLSETTEILKIRNPEKLKPATAEDLLRKFFENVGTLGAERIIKQYQTSCLYSFIYNNRLYHITADKEGTFVSEIAEGTFKKLQQISDQQLLTYDSKTAKQGNQILIGFSSNEFSGYIELNGQLITVYIAN